jgi:hypothetical protein
VLLVRNGSIQGTHRHVGQKANAMTHTTGLYIVLALAAIADVGTRALVPANVVDLSR